MQLEKSKELQVIKNSAARHKGYHTERQMFANLANFLFRPGSYKVANKFANSFSCCNFFANLFYRKQLQAFAKQL